MKDITCVRKVLEKFGDPIKETDKAIYSSDKDGIMWFFDKRGYWFEYEGGVKKNQGIWECDGGDNIKITDETQIYVSKDNTGWIDKPQVEQPVEDIGFSCILKNKGNDAKIDSNGESAWFWVDEPNKIAHIFYKKDNKWTQSKNGVEQFVGRWNCDEENHFLIVTDDESYSSRSDNWEKITKVGDSNDSFPLKFGSKGPNVVKLQKFLNNKISANPLTVNGIFDQKTQDKLIEFQKKEGIIE
jgi:hypothetical protein